MFYAKGIGCHDETRRGGWDTSVRDTFVQIWLEFILTKFWKINILPKVLTCIYMNICITGFTINGTSPAEYFNPLSIHTKSYADMVIISTKLYILE